MLETLIKCVLRMKQKIASVPSVRRALQRIRNESNFANLNFHESMLADKTRIDTYYSAIVKYVQEGDVVIDLGTGSGILAFLPISRIPG